jgi:DinB family protein
MNPHDILRYGQQDIEGLIARYTPAAWERIALGVWTAKDLLGHLGAYEVRFAEVVALFAGETPVTNLRAEPPATFNDDQAAVRRDWPVEAVIDELRAAHQRVMAVVDRIPPEVWREVGTIPWYGPEYSLDDLAVYTMYGHKREHGPQLGAVLEHASA